MNPQQQLMDLLITLKNQQQATQDLVIRALQVS